MHIDAITARLRATGDMHGWTCTARDEYAATSLQFTRPGEHLTVQITIPAATIRLIVGNVATGPVSTRSVDVRGSIDISMAEALLTGRARRDYEPTDIVLVVGDQYSQKQEWPRTPNYQVYSAVPGIYPVELVDNAFHALSEGQEPAWALSNVPGTLVEDVQFLPTRKGQDVQHTYPRKPVQRAIAPTEAALALKELDAPLPGDLTGRAVFARRADVPTWNIDVHDEEEGPFSVPIFDTHIEALTIEDAYKRLIAFLDNECDFDPRSHEDFLNFLDGLGAEPGADLPQPSSEPVADSGEPDSRPYSIKQDWEEDDEGRPARGYKIYVRGVHALTATVRGV